MSERGLIDQLLETLQELPHVHAQLPIWPSSGVDNQHSLDAEIRFDVAGRMFVLYVEIKKSVYPRDVRQILLQIKQFGAFERLNDQEGTAIALLAAESISPGAKELLRSENVGFYDTGGSLFIPASGAYFYIDKPPPKTLVRSIRTLFKGKRSQVLHALLIRNGEWFGVKTLAALAKVSPATASETLSELERFDWLSSRGKGPNKERQLVEPGALLDEWSKQMLAAREFLYRRYFVPSTRPEVLADEFARVCEMHDAEYVITQEMAAQRYTPFLSRISQVVCRMAPGRAAEEAVSELGARVVSEGANLMVIETKSQGEFLFKERSEHVWLASPVQVYLDLMCGQGRAKEMAEHLRSERIGF
jgi:hypothetical protein